MDNRYIHKGKEKKMFVKQMFDDISHRYDSFNHFSTFYIDKYWRNKFISKLTLKDNLRVLDIATGTGDIIINISKKYNINGIGLDNASKMLKIAEIKAKKEQLSNIEFIQADAEMLPFKDNSIDLITISFGIRNFENYECALTEIKRVLKPNGQLAILEFLKQRDTLIRKLFSFYFNHIIPLIGRLVTGKKIFKYLPESVQNFLGPDELEELMRNVGFGHFNIKHFTLRICSIITCKKLSE